MFTHNRIWHLLLAVLMSAAPLSAQVVTGTISGRVTDTTGAVIPGTTVQVQNVETGLSRNGETDAAGRYTVGNLPSGSYTITAQKEGFRTKVRSGVTLAVGSEVTLNLEMSVGAVQERVEVSGEAPAIETTTATLSGLVNPAQMRDLPLNGRSIDQLALLTPGVVNETQVSRATVLEGMGEIGDQWSTHQSSSLSAGWVRRQRLQPARTWRRCHRESGGGSDSRVPHSDP